MSINIWIRKTDYSGRCSKKYYQLTKPGIIYGNALTAAAGFLFAAKGHVDVKLLAITLIGTCLVIASACVINNCMDREIDKAMARTRKRALVTGEISPSSALVYAACLGLAGFAALVIGTNMAVVIVGAVGFIDYVVLYGWSKRQSFWGTIVGSVSGAMPVVAGYVAVTNRFDTGALLLFLILTFWQMPHFYAIALYRFDDYKNAGLPVFPVVKGLHQTKIQILIYIVGFMLAVASLTIFGYAGYTFLIAMMLLGLAWLWRGVRAFKTADDREWGRHMFLFSLIIILALSVTLSVGSVLA